MEANQDPAARKAAAMAKTRLTDEQIIALMSTIRQEFKGQGLTAAELATMPLRAADAQQAADYELLWPVIEAARKALCGSQQDIAAGYPAGSLGEQRAFDDIEVALAAIAALGLGPEGESE